jgi:hypothetical protein
VRPSGFSNSGVLTKTLTPAPRNINIFYFATGGSKPKLERIGSCPRRFTSLDAGREQFGNVRRP